MNRYCPNCGRRTAIQITEDKIYNCFLCGMEFVPCTEFQQFGRIVKND